MLGFLRRAVVRVTAGLLLLTVVAGLPTALVAFIGWPLPTTAPRAEWLTTPLSDTVVLNTLAVAAWLLWATFTHAVAAEAAAAWRGLPTRATTRQTANPLRVGAASLITGLTLGTLLAGTATAGSVTPPAASAAPAVVSTTGAPNPTVVKTAAVNLPAPQRGPATFHVGTRTYTAVVERDDTLSKIADEWLRDGDRWTEICDLNWHRHFPKVGGTLRDCNLIYPGWTLRLPVDARPPARAAPTPTVPPRAQPAPSSPTTPASPKAPSPTTATPQDPDGVVDPPAVTTPAPQAPTTSPAGTPTPTSPTTTAAPTSTADPAASPDFDAARAHADEDGVHLPGGSFVPWSLAAAITAAAALLWLQRRRRFIPGRPDDDPPPVPQPVLDLHRHVVRHPDLPTPTDLAERAAAVPDLPQLPAGGVGFTGDGAHAAARAALVAALASGGPRDPDRRGEVIIDGTTLSTLIGADAAALGPWPRLHVADDLDHALTLLDARLLHRSRILDEHDLTDLAALRARASGEEALPPVLLICETPPPGARMRARVSFGLGSGVDVSALLLGEWPHGCTVDVAADGRTRLIEGTPTSDITERLGILSTEAAVATLTTLREAHTGQPPTINRTPHPPATAPPPTAAPPPETGPSSDETTRPPTGTDPDFDANALISTGSSTNPPAAESTAVSKVQVRVFGFPRVDNLVLPGRSLRGKAAELAVYLVCHPDGADTRTIAEHLAPDSRVRQADQQIHTNASNLRHVLGRAGGFKSGEYLLKRGPSARYRLDPTTVEVDLWQLRDLLRRAQLASAPARTAMLRKACDLYTAPLADTCDYDWVEPHRETARQAGIEAHLLLADDLLNDDPQSASDLLDTAIGLDRYNEQLYVKAMHARHALHDADGIRTLLRALAKALADLDVEPADATVTLATQLRDSLEQQ